MIPFTSLLHVRVCRGFRYEAVSIRNLSFFKMYELLGFLQLVTRYVSVWLIFVLTTSATETIKIPCVSSCSVNWTKF